VTAEKASPKTGNNTISAGEATPKPVNRTLGYSGSSSSQPSPKTGNKAIAAGAWPASMLRIDWVSSDEEQATPSPKTGNHAISAGAGTAGEASPKTVRTIEDSSDTDCSVKLRAYCNPSDDECSTDKDQPPPVETQKNWALGNIVSNKKSFTDGFTKITSNNIEFASYAERKKNQVIVLHTYNYFHILLTDKFRHCRNSH
jgi:hypothetical protein